MKTKVCTKCKKRKSITKFSKHKIGKNGLRSQCKKCCKEYNIQWYNNNLKKVAIVNKRWRDNNKKKNAAIIKQWCKNNPEKKIAANTRYIQSSKGKLTRKRRREKERLIPKNKLNNTMRVAINISLKRKGASKNGCHWEILVGYTVQQLKLHLEKQFTEGMLWNNYGHGRNKWCIDHKKPIVSFNYNNSNHPDFKKCWGLKNLQPMWCSENFSKGAKDGKI